MTYPLATRNRILNAVAGLPGFSYPFYPMTQDPMIVALWNGDPQTVGVEVAAGDYSEQFLQTELAVYPLTVDGATKTYLGGLSVGFGPAITNWGNVTHWSIRTDAIAWVFPLASPLTPLLIGDFLQLSGPSLVLDPDDPTMTGPSVDLRIRILRSLFGNSFMPTEPLTGETFAAVQWDVALFVGDPMVAGVEPATWDYARLPFTNDSAHFDWTGTDGYAMAATLAMTWPMCQTDWGLLTHWGFYSNETNELYHCGPITSHPLGVDAVAGTRLRIPLGDWVAHLGEPI